MLEIKVILHHAGTGEVREIGSMHIAQVGRGEGDARDYHFDAWHEPPAPSGGGPRRGRRVERSGRVLDHDRSRPVWDLIARCLAAGR